jgi:hypothetical protein
MKYTPNQIIGTNEKHKYQLYSDLNTPRMHYMVHPMEIKT